jgi:hypothetical protein
MVVAVMALVESSYHLFDKAGPFETYTRAAVSAAAKRVELRFANTAGAASDAPANALSPRALGAEVKRSRIFQPVGNPATTMGEAYGPSTFGNPFVERLSGVFIPQPFTGYTGVQSAYPFRKDYFGYRNDEDVYFGRCDPNTRPEVLITWSGNSEAVGLTQETTVPQFLERILNKRDPVHAYKTLNIADNGYALNDEISAYVAVAYSLKPEFSITHSGITDLAYGGALPGGFKQLGLIYTSDAYYRWVDLIYDVQLIDNINPMARVLNPSHMDDLIPGILKSYDRFNSIVAGNGGELIHGLPPFNKARVVQSAYWDIWLPEKLKELHDAMPPGSFIDFTGRTDIVFHDSIHTETEAAKIYAEVYADEILRRMKTRKLDPARKGADLPLEQN